MTLMNVRFVAHCGLKPDGVGGPKSATFGSRRAHSIISSERTNEVGRLPIDYRSRSLLVCDTA